MFVARDVFRLKFGTFKEAKELLQSAKMQGLFKPEIFRFYSDFTGDSYRLIFEAEFTDLHAYEQMLKSEMAAESWQKWYAQFIPLVESSHRELLRKLNF